MSKYCGVWLINKLSDILAGTEVQKALFIVVAVVMVDAVQLITC